MITIKKNEVQKYVELSVWFPWIIYKCKRSCFCFTCVVAALGLVSNTGASPNFYESQFTPIKKVQNSCPARFPESSGSELRAGQCTHALGCSVHWCPVSASACFLPCKVFAAGSLGHELGMSACFLCSWPHH